MGERERTIRCRGRGEKSEKHRERENDRVIKKERTQGK